MENGNLNRVERCITIGLIALIALASPRQAIAQAARFTRPRPGAAESAARPVTSAPLSSSRLVDRETGGQRSIREFIDAQGTTPFGHYTMSFYETPYAPHLPTYAVGFTTANCPGKFCQYPTSRIVVIDYAGGAS